MKETVLKTAQAYPRVATGVEPPAAWTNAPQSQSMTPSATPPLPIPKPRSTLDAPESTEGRPSRKIFNLRPFRSSTRGPANHTQSSIGHPLEERSMSLPTGVEKKRPWSFIWSLATLRVRFGVKGKGHTGTPPIMSKEHNLKVSNVTTPEPRPMVIEMVPAAVSQSPPSLTPQETPNQVVPAITPIDGSVVASTEAVTISKQDPSRQIPQVIVNDRGGPPISREMPAHEVVSQLVEHGCEDLSECIDISTFGDHPVAIGGLSDIYRGCLTNRKPVAVKALRIAMQHSIGESPKHLRRAARELHTWSKCKHPNVLPLYGLVTFRDRIGMVSPWMSKGTLPQYLVANPDANRRDLCIQICEGLSHMHATGIIHGDLKGENVLVDDGNNAVLADFGSSTLKDQSLKFTQAASGKALTVRWSAPELVISNECQHTKASDVFALGMTIYEVLTGKVPYFEIKDVAPVILRIIQRGTPTRPVTIPDDHESGDLIWDLFTLCWKYAPEERPSAGKVAEVMKTIPLNGIIYGVPQAPDSVRDPPLVGDGIEATKLPDNGIL